MRTKPLSLSIIASLVLIAQPAVAHDGPHHDAQVQPPLPVNPAPALPAQPGEGTFIPPIGAANPAYAPEYQRARTEWVDECSRRYLSDRRRGNGGILGGLLGAVVGGVAGNRIDNDGSRLAGTLIGAGAGGVVGAVVGSAIDRNNRSKTENEALDWCEDYLARNTSAAPAPGYGTGYPYPPMGYAPGSYAMAYPYGPPVMMQPVMIPVQRCHEHVVVERPAYRTVTVRKVVQDKRIKVQPAKTVKYVKTIK